ncbi:hypothetical protein D3C75_1001520 [compost metagenome]
MLGILLPARRLTVRHNIGLAVIIKEQGGIDSGSLRQPHRIGPGTAWVLCRHVEIPSGSGDTLHEGGNHVEDALMVPDGSRINSLGAGGAVQIQLGRPVQHMAELPPMHQVLAVEDRHTREIFEGGDHQIIVIAYPANGRVRVEAGNNRVTKSRHIGLYAPLSAYAFKRSKRSQSTSA